MPLIIGAPFTQGTPRCPVGPSLPTLASVTCLLHLRADLGVTLNGAGEVTLWADQSGSGDAGRNFAPAGTDKPMWNPCYAVGAEGYGHKPTIGPFAKAGANNDCRLVSGTWNQTYGFSPDGSPIAIYVIGHAPLGPGRIFTYKRDLDRMELRTYRGTVEPPTPSAFVAETDGFGGDDYYPRTGIFTVPIYTMSNSEANLMGAEFNSWRSQLWLNALNDTYAGGGVAGDNVGGNTVGDYPMNIGCGGAPFTDALLYGVERIAEVIVYKGTPYDSDTGLPPREVVMSTPDRLLLRDYFNARYRKSWR